MASNPLLVDTREPAHMTDYIIEAGAPAKDELLHEGDYSFYDADGGLVLVSRKASDLLDSIFDGHMQAEWDKIITKIGKNKRGGSAWFLLEGVWAQNGAQVSYYTAAGTKWFRMQYTHHRVQPGILEGLQISLQSAGIQMLTTASQKHTAQTLAKLYKRAQEGWPTKVTKPVPRPKLRFSTDERVRRLMGLWPELAEKESALLIGKFGSITEVLRQDDAHLLEVKGVGAKTLSNLKEILN
ncbi:hypothetical protein LCGC14_0457980 [marine sediment metagenome]|uniref:ERCC4 domain-containing protein n=1 Tax=marine sediment metagenome TaxID=412755 RepID=A0A0F9SFY6_9ZZZZ